MTKKFIKLLDKMTPQEQAEVEAFAAFVVTRRKLKKLQVLTDDIPTKELMQLVEDSGSFDWLDSESEDLYSLEDGEAVKWPEKT
ncbi:MAG: hypothetical protein ACE5HS_20290 [bacterium]